MPAISPAASCDRKRPPRTHLFSQVPFDSAAGEPGAIQDLMSTVQEPSMGFSMACISPGAPAFIIAAIIACSSAGEGAAAGAAAWASAVAAAAAEAAGFLADLVDPAAKAMGWLHTSTVPQSIAATRNLRSVIIEPLDVQGLDVGCRSDGWPATAWGHGRRGFHLAAGREPRPDRQTCHAPRP